MAVSHSVVLYEPTETSAEVVTVAGFLAGYSGRTREAYTLDLRQFIRWCDEHRLSLFDVTRTHIELYARELEELDRAPATIGRRLSTLAGFYRYATEEGVIEHSPAVHVRRPKLDYESHAVGLDRNELGAFLVQAGLSSPRTTRCARCSR
jgi:site-specific recombinase XerD